MAYIKKLDIFDLAKRALADEALWGETEVMVSAVAAPRVPAVSAKAVSAVKTAAVIQPKAVATPAPAAVKPMPVAKPAAATGGNAAALAAFHKKIGNCQKCSLGKSRIKFVFGVGNPNAKLMFIGEGPGYDEDRQGEPFVGRAGQLLNKIIEAMGLAREDVYIANIVKCHPTVDPTDVEQRGNDRPPTPEEVAACMPYLEEQIDIIKPTVICALGNSAVHHLLKNDEGITKIRGTFFDYRGIKLMPTYHPAALLRNPTLKKDTWEDVKQIMAYLAEHK